MPYALIIAGGSGTRLWPMSRGRLPKQLIPFLGGQSLLQLAVDRLAGLFASSEIYICAGQAHGQAIEAALPALAGEQFLGEPQGRDTLNAVALGAAVLAQRDPDAVMAVFTADHVIEPVDRFQHVVREGLALAQQPNVLVTFGIAPAHAATAYGYLELGQAVPRSAARVVQRFKEKPDAATAATYFQAGPGRYLWNSGMFVWRAATLLDCVKRYAPANYAGLHRIAQAWDTPRRRAILEEVYPTLPKISVDYAVMEPASRDADMKVLALPMELNWLDVGSWPAFAQTCPHDQQGNASGGGRSVHVDSHNVLAASSDPHHLIATIGCSDLIVIHTPDATLVCRADRAEEIKRLYGLVGERWGQELQ